MTTPNAALTALIADGLLSNDAAKRKQARAALVAHGDPKVAAFFAADKRNYHSIADGSKLSKALAEFEALGADGAAVALSLIVANKPDPANGVGGVQLDAALDAALRYQGREVEVFEALSDVPEIYLPKPKKVLPPGLSRLRAMIYLRVPEGTIKSAQNIDELAAIPQRFKLALWVKDVELKHWRAAAENVSAIEFRGSFSNLVDAAPLSAWKNLADIDMGHTGVSDLSPLRALPLTRLRVDETKVTDLSPLASLKALRHLGLIRLAVGDFSPVWTLSQLESLDLSFTSVRDLSPLRDLRALRELGLWGTPVDSLEPLTSLPLESIDLNWVARPDLSPLARIPTLRQVRLAGATADAPGLKTLQTERPDVHLYL